MGVGGYIYAGGSMFFNAAQMGIGRLVKGFFTVGWGSVEDRYKGSMEGCLQADGALHI